MFERFAADARAVVAGAQEVARELGSPTIEAEHLLLAAARRPASPLADAGLDYDALLDALDAERTLSLAAIGIALEPPAASPPVDRPAFATSAKVAIQRALRAAVARGDKRMEARHVVLGVLRAQFGTVPRALEFAGFDRAALIARLDS
jgi:ATP-dependent Clp protease ATP-binding subunit ClpA